MAFADIEVMGNLGGEPEMRYTPSNKAVTQFSVAVNHSKPDGNGGWKDEGTDWYRVSTWGDQAERWADQLHKGSKVLVKGRFKTREFEGRDGATRTSLEIDAQRVVDLSPRQRDDEGSFGSSGRQAPARPTEDGGGRRPDTTDFDDLPF